MTLKSTTAAATPCPNFAALAAAPSPTAVAPSYCSPPPDGATEALMRTHGFTVAQMVELVRAGLASATAERVVEGRHMHITEEGRRVLAATPWSD
jgi:hypothetical protein